MAAKKFDADGIELVSSISNPGMISSHEEKLYYHMALNCHNDERIMLEIGTWLGRSTQRICDAISSLSPDWQLHCYDMFAWSSSYRERALGRGVDDLVNSLGDSGSFEPLFRAFMGDRSDRIHTHTGSMTDIADVLEGVWPAGMPVGMLFVDASKGWLGNVGMLKFFADRLLPGEAGSRILFQDFLYFPAYKLIFLIQLLNVLEIETYVESGTSVVVKLTDHIRPDNPLFEPGAFRNIAEKQVRDAWDRLLAQIPPERMEGHGLALSLPLMLWDTGHRDAATEEFAKITLRDEDMIFVRDKVNFNKASYKAKPLLEMIR